MKKRQSRTLCFCRRKGLCDGVVQGLASLIWSRSRTLMRPIVSRSLGLLLTVMLVVSCATRVPPASVQWSDTAEVLSPPASATPNGSTNVGYLRVETDTDVRVSGSLSYDNVRRPFDLYSPDGEIVRADIDNQGWRKGEEPVSLALPPGKYVVASMYGAVYRKVQVQIRPGATTEVSAAAMSDAPRVFAK